MGIILVILLIIVQRLTVLLKLIVLVLKTKITTATQVENGTKRQQTGKPADLLIQAATMVADTN
jgi:hypothetical protein